MLMNINGFWETIGKRWLVQRNLILVVVILLFCLGIYTLFKGEKPVILPTKQPVHYKDSDGKEHIVIEAAQVNSLKATIDSLHIAYKKQGKLLSIAQANSSTQIDLHGLPGIKDSQKVVTKYINNYIQLHDTLFLDSNKTNLSLSLEDTLTYIEQKKSHLFKPDEILVDIKNSNPYVHINDGKSFVLRPKKTVLILGVYGGVNVEGKPSIGLCIAFPLIRLNK